MGFLTHSLSKFKFKKAQFFVLSAFAIVTIIFFISRWIEPFTIIDTSAIALIEEPFIFNNIVDKARQTVETSKSCEELNFNLQEFKTFTRDFGLRKNYKITFEYTISPPCPASSVKVTFNPISVSSTRASLQKSFSVTKLF